MLLYTVRPYDSLISIADQFGTTYDQIILDNQLSSYTLRIGQRLVLSAAKDFWTDEPSKLAEDNCDPNETDRIYDPEAEDPYPIAIETGVEVPEISAWQEEQISERSATTTTYYTVRSGDSLSKIAAKFKVTTDALKRTNKLTTDVLRVGQILKIPTTTTNPPPPPPPPPANTTTQTPIYYTVVSGDSLGLVAKKKNVSVANLVKWNQLKNEQVGLLIGQKLIVGYQTNSTTNTNNPPPSPNTTNPTPTTTTPPNAQAIVMPALSFSYERMRLSASVGQGATNRNNDVRMLQNCLLKTGFLTPEDHAKEIANETNNSISSHLLPQTIDAIVRFNQIVANIDDNESQIMPDSHSLMYLNSAAEIPDPIDIAASRSNIIVEERSAQILLGEGLTGAVGATNFGNKVDDVRKVQQALRLWGYAISNNETPKDQLPIDPAKLPQTIAAIRKFQADKVDYWRGKRDVTASTIYEDGLVGKDESDLTYKILKVIAEYKITFSVANVPQTVQFRNLQRTPYTVDLGGVSFVGSVLPSSLSTVEYENFGLNKTEAKALQYVSEHEGNFDAINTYDRAIFSYGFIQFAGGGRGLAPMLAMIKHDYPNAFKQRFQNYGIDVEYSIESGEIKSAQIAVFDLRINKWVRRAAAENLLKNDKQFTAIFIRAAYHPDIQRGQIASAARKYVTAALNIRFSKHLKIGDQIVPCANKLLTQVLRSEKALTVLIDLTVNRWTVATRDLFESAIGKIALFNGLNTYEKLCSIDENAVLRQIVQQGDLLVQKRVKSVLDNDQLSSRKS